MYMNGVLHAPSITTGEGDGDGDAARAGGFEHEAVAFLQTLERQGQAAELVFLVRISAGEIVNQVGLVEGPPLAFARGKAAVHSRGRGFSKPVKDLVERVAQEAEVSRVGGEVGQADVKVRGRLGVGVVVLLV